MKKRMAIILIGMVLLGGISHARAEGFDPDLVVVARPASILVDASGDKFKSGNTSMSTVFTMPNVSAGIGFEVGEFYVDLTGGAGILFNDTFRTFTLDATLAANYAVSESLDIGPRVGLIYFVNPEWLEDDLIEFDSDSGLFVGLQIAMGDKIQYVASVDLIDVGFDVEGTSAAASDDEFKLDGLAIQFGVRGEF